MTQEVKEIIAVVACILPSVTPLVYVSFRLFRKPKINE